MMRRIGITIAAACRRGCRLLSDAGARNGRKHSLYLYSPPRVLATLAAVGVVATAINYNNGTPYVISVALMEEGAGTQGHKKKTSSSKSGEGSSKKQSTMNLPDLPWAERVIEDPEAEYKKENDLPVEVAKLGFAPNVPPPITRNHPALVKVNLTCEVKKFQLNPKYKYVGW
jgi:hypothetical protein